MRIWLYLALGLVAGASELGVVYTGRLIGYARACAEERFRRDKIVDGVQYYNRVCVSATGGYGEALGKLIAKARASSEQSILVGAGDHFSLDYRARSVIVETKDGDRAVGKDELFHHEPLGWIILSDVDPKAFRRISETQAGAIKTIEGDATAQFLIDAKYDALVPGKHDFYFGAERLRQTSRLLARQEKPVQMLGTNLVIAGRLLDPPVRVPERFRKKNYLDSHTDVSIGLPSVVLPWLRRVAISGTAESVVLCPVGSAGRDQACTDPKKEVALERGAGRAYRLPKAAPALEEVRSYHVCARRKEGLPVCTVFDVARPYFQYGAENSSVPFPAPYFVDKARNVVVMGVVAPGLERQVGLLNTVWLDPKNRHELRVVTIDAIQSVEQLLDYCEARGDCIPDRRMVLLAQMPDEAAASLHRGTGKRFDLVIAEANAYTHTPFPQVDYPGEYPALVVSPKPVYDGKRPAELAMHAQMVVLRGKREPFRSLALEAQPHPLLLEAGVEMESRINGALTKLNRHPGANLEASFRQLILETMRERVNGSVALLQKRDLFEVNLFLAKV